MADRSNSTTTLTILALGKKNIVRYIGDCCSQPLSVGVIAITRSVSMSQNDTAAPPPPQHVLCGVIRGLWSYSLCPTDP